MIRVQRSYPAPASLAVEEKKKSGRYDLPDVTRQLREDFCDKCYICELKPVADPEVEHRLPHKGNTIPGRKFDWDNLFWSCSHCNSVKNQNKYDAGILDCCKYDPEDYLEQELVGNDVRICAKDLSNSTAVLTADLIYETFNKENTGIREAACDIRVKALQQEMGKLYTALGNYREKPESKHYRKNIQVLLRREGAFAAFKRFYVKSHLDEYPALAAFLV